MVKNHSRRIFAAFAAAVLAVVPGASAQIDEGRQMVTAFIGGQFFDIGGELENFGRVYADRANIGVRYLYNVTDRFGVEGDFLFSPTHTELQDPLERSNIIPRTEDILQDEADISSFYTMGNLVYSFLRTPRWAPFVTGGVGVVVLDAQNAPSETTFGGNFGAGLLFRPHERVGLRLDLRDYVYDAGDLDAETLEAIGLPGDFGETIHDLSFDVGVSFFF